MSFQNIFFLAPLVLAWSISGAAQAGFGYQRMLFQDASLALNRHQMGKFHLLLKQLDDYPVKAYLEYDAFKQGINRIRPDQVDLFLEANKDYPFVYHARGKWLSVLAGRKDWKNYLKYFDGRENTRLTCLAFQARLKLKQFKGLVENISRVWMRGYSQPRECDPAFVYFIDNNADAEQAIWSRIEKAFNARRPSLARYLGKRLSKKSKPLFDSWYQAHRRPEKALQRLLRVSDNSQNRTVITHALNRLSRKQSLRALEFWDQLRKRFQFSDEQRNLIDRRIALSAAYQHEPLARQLLMALDAPSMNDQAYLWLARIQLRAHDWPGLLKTIQKMPSHLQQENEWQYWMSRAMEIDGHLTGSLSLLEKIAGKSSYYGFLAADKLKRNYRIEQENVITAEIQENVFLAANPHMLRARELYFLGRPVDAKREWFQALRTLDQHQIKQAATLASKWKWYDNAIRTVAQTSHRQDYSLRFPMPYKQQVAKNAASKNLDVSLIYGVMRRESLFDPFARSSVGALGLMQLMPNTARRVARSLGLKRPRRADILHVDNNIRFGTYYLKSMMNRFDNNVTLAAAAYNAGPGNVKRWLPRQSNMPADLWVETIPFKETRNYVEAVLAYSTVFDKSLGNKTLMSSRMLDIKAKY